MPGRYRSRGTPFFTLGVRKSPASTIFAAGSPALMPLWKTFSNPTYCFGLGFEYQKLGELTSFQSCQSTTGSLGILGFCDQKVPLLPYLSAAARTKAWKSSNRSLLGGWFAAS